jgi:hypothetical protein
MACVTKSLSALTPLPFTRRELLELSGRLWIASKTSPLPGSYATTPRRSMFLNSWHSKGRQPHVIRGAKGVGKTWFLKNYVQQRADRGDVAIYVKALANLPAVLHQALCASDMERIWPGDVSRLNEYLASKNQVATMAVDDATADEISTAGRMHTHTHIQLVLSTPVGSRAQILDNFESQADFTDLLMAVWNPACGPVTAKTRRRVFDESMGNPAELVQVLDRSRCLAPHVKEILLPQSTRTKLSWIVGDCQCNATETIRVCIKHRVTLLAQTPEAQEIVIGALRTSFLQQ